MADKIDPVIATSFRIVGDHNGAVLAFERPVYSAQGDGTLSAEMIHSTAVSVTWALVEDMHRVFENVIDQRKAAIASAARGEAPPEAPKPN